MKKIISAAACMAVALFGYAQNTTIGKVVDASSNTPLSGATIAVGGKNITTTDASGNFTIDCRKASRIIVSYVGYETIKHTIRNCNEEVLVSLQPSSQSLNTVEITATSAENKSMLFQPASISKLNTTELKRGTGLFLDEAINANVPGVTMNRRSVSGGQQFNIRGYGNGVRGTNGVSSNFDGQGYKVYLNGIPVTDAEGITLMDDIDFGSIGSVEILKGPAGSLYGLAIAGAVNLKTIKPKTGERFIGQDVMVGNYGLRRYTTHYQSGTEKSSLLLNYGYQHSDGFMAHAESEKRFLNFAGDFHVNAKQAITVYAGYSDSYDERGGEVTLTQWANQDYSGNPAYIQRNAHSNIISFRMGAGHEYRFNEHVSNNTTVFGTAMTNNASSAAGWTDKTPMNYGVRSVFDTRFDVGPKAKLNGITGVEFQRQHAQVIGYNMKADPANPTGYYKIDTMRSNQYYVTSTSSVFTEWTLSLSKDISITAGLGLSNMYIDLNDRFVRPGITRPMQYKNQYTNMLSPRVAINKVFSEAISVYASYSKGYKAPVSSYFFVPVSTTMGFVNDSLKPEIGNQVEIGTKGALLNSRLVYQVALFNAIFSDKMTAVAVPLNPPEVGTAYSYVANGGDQDHKGIEVFVKYTAYQSATGAFRAIRPFANLAFSKFRYEDYRIERLKTPATSDTIIDYSGKPVAGVSPVVANLGIDIFAVAGIYANVVYQYKDPMPITSDNLNMTTSYNLLNAKLGIQRSLGRHFDIDAYFGVNNITGTQYPFMVFVNQLPDAYLPAPLKANYFGGLNLRYNF